MHITNIIKKMLLVTVCGLLLFSTAYSAEQVIYPQPENIVAIPDTEVSFDVYYTTSDQNSNLTGLGLRMHWNSNVLEFKNVSQVYAHNLFVQGEPERGIKNYFGDEFTDSFANYSWLDIDGEWPLNSLPLKLFQATFKVLSHENTTTQVTFSGSSSPAGYSIVQVPLVVETSYSVIEATVVINPETLHLNAQGQWITAYVELPDWYAVYDIEIFTAALLYNNKHLLADWGEIQQDGQLMFKFDWATVAKWFEGINDEEVELAITGEVDENLFIGSTTIRVISRPSRGR